MRKSSSTSAGLEERRDRVRPAFGEDQPVAALAERRDRADRIDGLPERDDCAVGQPSREPRGAGIGGEHDRPGRERRVLGVDAPAAGDDRDLGLRRPPEPLPQLGERRCGRRERLLRRPDRSRRGGHRPRPDHQHVAAGAEQPEQRTGRLRSPRRRSCSTRAATGSPPPRRSSRRSSRTRAAPRTRASRRTPRPAPRAARTPAAPAPRTAPRGSKGLAPPALALPGRVRCQAPADRAAPELGLGLRTRMPCKSRPPLGTCPVPGYATKLKQIVHRVSSFRRSRRRGRRRP